MNSYYLSSIFFMSLGIVTWLVEPSWYIAICTIVMWIMVISYINEYAYNKSYQNGVEK